MEILRGRQRGGRRKAEGREEEGEGGREEEGRRKGEGGGGRSGVQGEGGRPQ